MRLIKFSTPGLNYDPGDVVMLTPHNSTQHVESFFKTVLSLKPDTVISVMEVTADAPVPNYLKRFMTLRSCAEEYWDLNVSKNSEMEYIYYLQGFELCNSLIYVNSQIFNIQVYNIYSLNEQIS